MPPKPTIHNLPQNLIFPILLRWAQVFVLNIRVAILWIKNLVLFKKLKMQDVYIFDSVVIDGNQVNLLWNVDGCYKVKVENLGVFPGNLSGIRFIFNIEYNPLYVTFYGVFRKYTQQVDVRFMQVNVLDRFETICSIPLAFMNSPQISVKQLSQAPEKLLCELSTPELKFGQVEIRFEKYPILNI